MGIVYASVPYVLLVVLGVAFVAAGDGLARVVGAVLLGGLVVLGARVFVTRRGSTS
jgi:hypothetical protein